MPWQALVSSASPSLVSRAEGKGREDRTRIKAVVGSENLWQRRQKKMN